MKNNNNVACNGFFLRFEDENNIITGEKSFIT